MPLEVEVPNTLVFGVWATVIVVQVWGKYMIIGYLDSGGIGLKALQCSGFWLGIGEPALRMCSCQGFNPHESLFLLFFKPATQEKQIVFYEGEESFNNSTTAILF